MAFSFTDRVYLGTIADISSLVGEPANPPAAGATAIENTLTIPLALDSSRTLHFEAVEICCEGMTPANIDIVVYHSRTNPAPREYSGLTDAADTWVTDGGATVRSVPIAAGGNSFVARVHGGRWITFKVLNASGAGAVPVRVYGLPDREGGW